MKNIIEIRDVSKRFLLTTESYTLFWAVKKWSRGKDLTQETWALNGINLDVERGDKIGIVGSNGSGKTTLLKILLGIYRQTHGEICVNGSIVGFLSLGLGMHRDLSGFDNIYLFGAIMGLHKSEIDKRINSIIAFSELRKFIFTPLRDYSTGMVQRLAVSITFASSCEIMIFDEMLVGGDADFQKKCYETLEDRKTDKKTYLFATHNLDLTEKICNKALLLDKGRQVAFGPTREVINIYKSIAADKKI